MNHVEIRIREYGLPADAEPVARHVLSTGLELDLTLDEWRELHAWLDMGAIDKETMHKRLLGLDEIAP